MKAKNKLRFISDSPEKTQAFGRAIGRLARPGTVLALSGDLGCGKTVLIQGVARGLGVPADCYVTSPTYTLMHEYPGRYPLIHVDLYRLDHSADLFEIGLDDKLHEQAIVAIEWSDKLDDDLFAEYISIHLLFVDDHSRRIDLTAYGQPAIDLLNELDNLNGS